MLNISPPHIPPPHTPLLSKEAPAAPISVPQSHSAVQVQVQDDVLRPPKDKDVEVILNAVDDIRLCEKIFDKWATELDKAPSDSGRRDKPDRTLRFYLNRLRKWAKLCTKESDEILQCHVKFARLMAQRIDDASESQYTVDAGPEVTNLSKDISKASRFLLTNVNKMALELGSFVRFLGNFQVKAEKKPSLAERILRWLEFLFKAIAKIFTALTPSMCGTVRHHSDPNVRGGVLAVTALRHAASEFQVLDLEPQPARERNESESFDSVILFLKDIVPNEARSAQEKLKLSDKSLTIMERMGTGQQVALCGSDPAAKAKEWRRVAEQYQSAFGQTLRS